MPRKTTDDLTPSVDIDETMVTTVQRVIVSPYAMGDDQAIELANGLLRDINAAGGRCLGVTTLGTRILILAEGDSDTLEELAS